MGNKTRYTALNMGFYPVSSGVLEGKVNNIQEEINLLKSIVEDAKKNPYFRQLATQIINSFPCQHKNYDCYVYAIAKWVKENIKYIKDITGYETLQTPENTLKIGGGDCDDHAILVATLLNAIGVKTAFKIVGENGRYKHIYVIATTPKGKKWVVDTTEEHFFYPEKNDEEYEMEILQDLEGLEELGWGFKPGKFFKRATGGIRKPGKFIKSLKKKPFSIAKKFRGIIPKPVEKINPVKGFKPVKAVKRATGGIRRPNKVLKRIQRKPFSYINKTVRPLLPKPVKATFRAMPKPVKKTLRRVEKINPIKVKNFKPVKAVKRATASRSIDEAGTKIAAAVIAGSALAPAVAKTAVVAAPAVSKTVSTTISTAANVLPQIAQQIPQGSQQAQQTNRQFEKLLKKLEEKLQEKEEKHKTEDMFKNPFVIAAGILALGLILGGRS